MTAYPPQMNPERLDQMIAYATSFAQEKRKATFLETLLAYKMRLMYGAGSAFVAASVLFVVLGETPQPNTARNVPTHDVSDMILYDLLEDLS